MIAIDRCDSGAGRPPGDDALKPELGRKVKNKARLQSA
jgi:hypothetical protein